MLVAPILAEVGWAMFQADNSSAVDTIQELKVGAGGQLTSIDIECDQGIGQCNNSGTTTKVIRADTYGAYVWVPSGGYCYNGNTALNGPCWQQLVTTSSMPARDPSVVVSTCQFDQCGAYEIAICPANTNIAAMFFNGYVYTTNNLRSYSNATWSATGFRHIAAPNPNDDTTKFEGPFIAFDPANCRNFLVGTPSSGAFYTTNGGTSFAQITGLCTPTIPSGGRQGGGYVFAFDPSSSVVSGDTQGIYLGCYGSGVYHSTTGMSGTFSLLNSSGMPTNIFHIICTSVGRVYVTDGTNLNEYAAGKWSQLYATGQPAAQSVAVDPNNLTHILISGSQASSGWRYSTNGGASWGNRISANKRTATDIPWLANTNEASPTSGNIMFDPAQSNIVYFAEGIGVSTLSPALTGISGGFTYALTSQSLGIEQLVANWIVSPPGGNVILTARDRPVWTVTNPNVFPSNHGVNYNQAIEQGYSADWAANTPGFIAVLSNCGTGSGANDTSGYSTNGGGTGGPANWTIFSALPRSAACGGSIAALDSNHILIGQNSNGNLYYSANGGTSWTQVVCSGVPTTGTTGWGNNQSLARQIVAADRVNSVYYAYNYNGQAGIYQITSTGDCTRVSASAFESSNRSNFNAQMRTVPGQAGHIFYTSGNQGGDPVGQALHWSTNGGLTWKTIRNVESVWSFGFGAPMQASDGYPTIYLYGWVNCGQSGVTCLQSRAGYTVGLWRGVNIDAAAPQWKQLTNGFIGGWLDGVRVVEGDNNTAGVVYVGFQGSGWKWGHFN
jgi:hypothetical protein